jgi:hypothetical protein
MKQIAIKAIRTGAVLACTIGAMAAQATPGPLQPPKTAVLVASCTAKSGEDLQVRITTTGGLKYQAFVTINSNPEISGLQVAANDMRPVTAPLHFMGSGFDLAISAPVVFNQNVDAQLTALGMNGNISEAMVCVLFK